MLQLGKNSSWEYSVLCMDMREIHFILQTDFIVETQPERESSLTLKFLSEM